MIVYEPPPKNECAISKGLRSGKIVAAPIRHRIHLTRSQDAPKKAARVGIPNDRPCTVSRIDHEVGALPRWRREGRVCAVPARVVRRMQIEAAASAGTLS